MQSDNPVTESPVQTVINLSLMQSSSLCWVMFPRPIAFVIGRQWLAAFTWIVNSSLANRPIAYLCPQARQRRTNNQVAGHVCAPRAASSIRNVPRYAGNRAGVHICNVNTVRLQMRTSKQITSQPYPQIECKGRGSKLELPTIPEWVGRGRLPEFNSISCLPPESTVAGRWYSPGMQ